jgi:hypothetical protein
MHKGKRVEAVLSIKTLKDAVVETITNKGNVQEEK